MNSLKTLLKKEFFEAFVTKKILILWITCLGIGLMSPIFAKFTPNVLALYAPKGMNFSIGVPSAKDAWYQFFKDGPSMSVLISVLCFSNSIPNEIESGSIVNVLSKGIGRNVFFCSKLVAALITWICAIIICVTSCYIYTQILFNDNTPINWCVSLIGPMCFGIFAISLLFLFEAISANALYSIGCTIAFFVLLLVINIFKVVNKYNPISLIQNNTEYIFSLTNPQFFYWKIGVCIILITIINCLALKKFKNLAI